MPMKTIRSGNGVSVIAIAHIPWARIAITGVCHRGWTSAAAGKNARRSAIA
jgi:hypothetical protein